MSYSENNTYEKILSRMLEQDVLINMDKREGSVIYDALAPCAMELAEAYLMIDILQEQTYLMTATGSNLDKRVYDYGMSRTTATQALRIGSFKCYKTDDEGEYVLDDDGNKILVDMEIGEGQRFMLPDDSSLTYEYMGKTDGYEILQCEQSGTQGNSYIGQILPITPVNGLIEAKIISTYEYGEDEESDDDLRSRAEEYLNYMPYGGNISDYIEKVNAISGVGNCKVFPAWQYNGSVLISVVDPTYNPVSEEFMKNIKSQIDPEENSGEGVGIAPIGHFVTITTPVEETVNISMTVEYLTDAEEGEANQVINEIVEEYIDSVRRQFAQDVRLSVYRSKIIELVMSGAGDYILNIDTVLLNGNSRDLVWTDEGQIGMQYLPKLGDITIISGTSAGED
jgi:uncharacterized phage protein gp47/JayE